MLNRSGLSGASYKIQWPDKSPALLKLDWESANAALVTLKSRDVTGNMVAMPESSILAVQIDNRRAAFEDMASGSVRTSPFEAPDDVSSFVIGPFGRQIAAVTRSGGVRFFSALDGAPIAPTFRSIDRVENLVFLPDGSGVIARGKATLNFWELSLNAIEPSGAHAEIQLQSERRVEADGRVRALDGTALRMLWTSWAARGLPSQTVSTRDHKAWDKTRAHQAEASENWRSALFHLARLRAAAPEDENLARRLARAKTKVALLSLKP